MDGDYDSDTEDGFSFCHQFELTENRHQRRNSISPEAKLDTIQQNKDVISQFISWWKASGASCVTTNKKTSTIRMTLNYLFHNKDSFLNYQTSQNKDFNLQRLKSFNTEDYLALPSPVSWVAVVGGKSGQLQPSRRKEMLKSHQRLRKFLLHLLNENGFEGSEILIKEAVEKHLEGIKRQVKLLKLYGQLQKLYKQQKKKKERMMAILKPHEKENVFNAVKVWFSSEESKKLETEALAIYTAAIANQSIRKADFNRFSKIVFFELMIFDKSRVGIIENLTNEDYQLKKAACGSEPESV